MKYIKDFQVWTDPLGYMLTWQYNSEYQLDAERWDVCVERALDVPENVTKVIELPDFVEFYRDILYKDDSHYFNKSFWYTLVLKDNKTGEKYKTEPISILEQEDSITKSMRKDLKIQLEKGGGTHGYLFKMRRGGKICECYNPLLKKTGNPNCTKCYGTGYLGGYLPGIEFYGTYLMHSNQTLNKKPILTENSISVLANLIIPAYEGDFLYFDIRDVLVKISASKIVSHGSSILYQSILGQTGERYDILRRFLSVHLGPNRQRERTYIPFKMG